MLNKLTHDGVIFVTTMNNVYAVRIVQ
jgi:hypothetical protein